MIKDRIFKSEFLNRFLTAFPDYPHRLRSTLHSFSDKNRSPYHLEDDCWSHTMMVYNSLDISGLDDNSEDVNNHYRRILLTAALCHDNGKPYVRKSHSPGKINFWGHDQAGTQTAAEICYKLFYDDHTLPAFNKMLYTITFLVGHHINAYSVPEKKVVKFFNDDPMLAELMIRLLNADVLGQFTLEEQTNKHHFKDADHLEMIRDKINNPLNWTSNWNNDDSIKFYAGIPGCGKDFLADADGYQIISYDKLGLDHWIHTMNLSKTDLEKIPETELYSRAYEGNKKVNIHKLMETYLDGIDDPYNLAICNTMCNTKARIKLINIVRNVFGKDIKIDCIYVLTNLDNAIQNDMERNDKHVEHMVIKNFAYNQKVPSLNEGFNSVKTIFNNYRC